MTNNENEVEKKVDELELAKAEMTVKKVQEVLLENGMEIQVILAGYPFMIRPEVRVVPRKENKEETNDEVKITA